MNFLELVHLHRGTYGVLIYAQGNIEVSLPCQPCTSSKHISQDERGMANSSRTYLDWDPFSINSTWMSTSWYVSYILILLTHYRSNPAGWFVNPCRYTVTFMLNSYIDLSDHWTARSHKKEREWFILQLQDLAMLKRLRITFLAGDVHCTAVGLLKTLTRGRRNVDPKLDHRYMLNVISSAIVNTP